MTMSYDNIAFHSIEDITATGNNVINISGRRKKEFTFHQTYKQTEVDVSIDLNFESTTTSNFQKSNDNNNSTSLHFPYHDDDNKYSKYKSKMKKTWSNEDLTLSKSSSYSLQTINRKPNFNYYKIPLRKNENLHSISLKYKCPVWELKRANHLWGSQEIYARKELLVPAMENSLRSELLIKDGCQRDFDTESSDLSNATMSRQPHSDWDTDDSPVHGISLPQNDECQEFLRTMDADLEKIKQGTCYLQDSNDDEVTAYLTDKSMITPVQTTWYDRFKCAGADFGGISWPAIIVFLAVVCLVVPLLTFLFIKYYHPHH